MERTRMARAADAWLDYISEERRLAPSSVETYRSNLTKGLRLLPAEFSEREFRKAMEERLGGHATSHVRRATYVVFNQFLTWWERHGGPINYLAAMQPPVKPDVHRRALTEEEITVFVMRLRSASPKDRVMSMLLLYQGFRVSDVTNLTVKDIDFKGGRIRCRQGKGGTDLWLPMGPTMGDALHGYLDLYDIGEGHVFHGVRGKMSTQAVWGAFKRVCGPKLQHLMPHQARHTYASQLWVDTKDPEVVRRLMRHRDMKTTQRYLTLDPEAERGAILSLDKRLAEWNA